MGYLEKLSRFLDYSFINKVKTRAKELEKILWDLNNVLENYSVIKFSEKQILQKVWDYNDAFYSDNREYKENPGGFILYSQNRFFDNDKDAFSFCTTSDGIDYVFRTHITGILALSEEASKDLLYSEINKLKRLKQINCPGHFENFKRFGRYPCLLEVFRLGFTELEERKTDFKKRVNHNNSDFLDST
ncbi:hypothetical protein DRJ22_04880 [Candidatus Woesearchaeota archaeon]|nr:MAG: hypothetical protein DRJ22_04880 [Candidatus Woesearchaeota archaeon]